MDAGTEAHRHGPVVALAGRRIDAPDAPPRFPAGNARRVAERVRAFLVVHNAAALVSSAACGADVLAQEQAVALGLDRHIILPFDPARFRESSVTDRGGDWGARYDGLLAATPATALHVLEDGGDADASYAAVNAALLDEAETLAKNGPEGALRPVLAVIVWEGQSRGEGDLTADFATRARTRGIPIAEIATVP